MTAHLLAKSSSAAYACAVHGILGLSELLEKSLQEAKGRSQAAAGLEPLAAASAAVAADAEQELQYCRTIRECAQLLQSLVSNVLDYSKVGAAERMGACCTRFYTPESPFPRWRRTACRSNVFR